MVTVVIVVAVANPAAIMATAMVGDVATKEAAEEMQKAGRDRSSGDQMQLRQWVAEQDDRRQETS